VTTGAQDRIALLLGQSELTGIDFVYVYPSQNRLDVYFLRAPETLDNPLPSSLTRADIRIENVRDFDMPDVVITALNWAVVDGRTVMRLEVIRPASFAHHRLTILDPNVPTRIDPFFSSDVFSFQANCPPGIDCEPDEPPPFPETYVDFPVDYTARDFVTFRRALLDFASQRYPHWQDRLEADVGIMLVEVLSALGDEMAFYQDRIANEAYLETATQRLSLRQHARLVNYEPFDGSAATTWIDVTVNAGSAGIIPAGARIGDADGRVIFEIGTGLFDTTDYAVDAARNQFLPYFWDEDDTVLPGGSTFLDVRDDVVGAVNVNALLLLETNPADPSDPAVRLLITLESAVAAVDPLTGDAYTRLTWREPTPYLIDKINIDIRGNILPATAGETRRLEFSIGTPTVTADATPPPRAIQRRGADGTPIYRFSLPDSDILNLSRLYNAERGGYQPEIRVYGAEWGGSDWRPVVDGGGIPADEWAWRASFLGASSSLASDTHFTLDDGMRGRVAGYPVLGSELIHEDYLTGLGWTIRFGDGEFGALPPVGNVFVVDYRVDVGENLPRHVLTRFLPDPLLNVSFVTAITNPIEATGASPAESAESVRLNAPEAFRAVTYRAVRPEDYAEAVERLAWVQRAGAVMRWTGSWRTIFVSADPSDAFEISTAQLTDMHAQIDRFRQAGQDAQARPPKYADIDIDISVCADSFVYAGMVKEAVQTALIGEGGFFSPDNFTFGTRLYRGALEAAAANVYGVLAVESIRIRRRGWFEWREFGFDELFYDAGIDAVIRVGGERLYPEHGTLHVNVRGGA